MAPKALIAASVALLAPFTLSSRAGAASVTTIEIKGGDLFSPGHFYKNNFRFTPATLTVKSGSTVQWVDHDRSPFEPHTVSVADEADVPKTIAEINRCYGPHGFCSGVLAKHDPDGDGEPPYTLDVNEGAAGFDTRGDSALLGGTLRSSVSVKITAKAGSTLYYMCTIHPWMQAQIVVN